MSRKKKQPEQEVPLFDITPDMVHEEPDTPGQIANRIFRDWYEPYYKGKYTQSAGHVMKVLTNAVKNGVSTEELQEAMKLLGRTRQPVTELSLQYHLVIARKNLDSNTNLTDMGIERHVEEFDPTNPDNYR